MKQYRSDIDGLRAVAIVPIVLFHAAPMQFRGGFVGVDIFFVISGFLITGIIAPEIAGGQFSLLEFYRRRVVRILPALLAMIALVCLAGCFLLLPSELRSLGESAVWAAGFASNIYFWGHTGYFGTLDIQPLLHSWSLAVEEQFYLAYPLFLMALHRWAPRHARLVLIVAGAGSAATAWLLAIDHPIPAFYLLPTRAWELALGGLVALGFPKVAAPSARQWIAVGALTAILVSIALPWRGTTVPVPAVVPACVGAALLIAYGAEGATAKLLSLAPLRWLGLISYSWYLWHWPVLSFFRAWRGGGLLGFQDAVLAVAAGLVAAILSYRLVEQPVRRRFKHGGRPGRIVLAGIAASLVLGAGAAGLAANANRIRPLPPEVARILAYLDYGRSAEFRYQFGPIRCFGGTLHFDAANCLRTSATRRNVMVLGDSHAAHLWRAIAERFPQDNVMQANSTMCRPLIGTGGGRLCREMFDRAMAAVAQPGKVQSVVLAGEWSEDEIGALAPTIRAIRTHGVDVTVVGPAMRYDADLPSLLAHAMLRHDRGLVAASQLDFVPALDAEMRKIVLAEGARYFSLYGQECPSGVCRTLTRGGVPMHFDTDHLTLDGARELVAGLEGV